MNPRVGILVLAVFLLLPLGNFVPAAFAAPTADENSGEVLTFQDFYLKVVDYYPKLKSQDANLNLAIARKLEAVSGFLPRLQASTGITRTDDPVYVFGALLREEEFTQSNFALPSLNSPGAHTSYNVTLAAQVTIFDAMQTISRVKSAKLHIDSAEYEKKFTRMEAFLVASEAYLKAVALEQTLQSVEEVSQASEKDIEQAESLKDKGLILGADFYAAKVALGKINQLKNELAQQKQAMHIVLNVLMGREPLSTFEIQDQLKEAAVSDKSLQTWFYDAYQSRPDLASLDKLIAAQSVEVKREKSSVLPKVNAFGEAREDADELSSDGGKNYMVGLKAEVDLFDPSYSSRIKISKENLKKLELDKIQLRDKIAQDLSQEFARFQSNQENLPLIQSMLADSKEAVNLTLPLYREGRKSIADLLSIRVAYLNSAQGFYAAVSDSHAALTRLQFLSGNLSETNINELIQKISE